MGSTFYSKRYRGDPGRNRAKRPRKFISEDAAKKWAAENKVGKCEIQDMPYSSSGKKKLVILKAD